MHIAHNFYLLPVGMCIWESWPQLVVALSPVVICIQHPEHCSQAAAAFAVFCSTKFHSGRNRRCGGLGMRLQLLSDDSHLLQCFFHPGSDQELHDDAFEGCGLSPWKLNNAQGQYTFMALSF